jgi:hypothetical protein
MDGGPAKFYLLHYDIYTFIYVTVWVKICVVAELGVEVLAVSVYSLGLQTMEHEVALGREVVVKTTDAQARCIGCLAHRQPARPNFQNQRRYGAKDLALPGKPVFRRASLFTEHHDLFLPINQRSIAKLPAYMPLYGC